MAAVRILPRFKLPGTFWSLLEHHGRWSLIRTLFLTVPFTFIKSNTSSEPINRPKLFLDASLPQKKGKSYFNSHHTPLYEDDFSHDFLCACVKERVEIKNKTNKDQTKSTCPEGAHTRRTMAVQQMTPPKCKIFHNVMAALKCYTFWRSSVNHLRGLSQLSNRDGLFFLSSHNWQGTRFRIELTDRTERQPANHYTKKKTKEEPEKERGQASCFYPPSLPNENSLTIYLAYKLLFEFVSSHKAIIILTINDTREAK